MDLKPGYKRTEVGTLPEDWDVRQLKRLAERIMVGIASGATHAYRDHGILMFRNQNIRPNHLDASDVLYIDTDYEHRFRNKRLKVGDLLTARTGYPGTTAIVPVGYEGAQTFTTLITRPRNSLIDAMYLCFFINSEKGQAYFAIAQAGGSQQNVNAGSLKFMPIAVPPTKEEQRRIAEALRDADALIESLEQLLAKKRQIKQGAMQELLTGKKRLPGFSGEWRVGSIGDFADSDPENLGANTASEFAFNYIALEDVDCGVLKGYSEQAFERAPSRARRLLRTGDLLVSTVRPNLLSHLLFSRAEGNWVCSTGFCVLRCRPGISHPDYIFAHLFTDSVKRQVDALLTGSNYPAINSGDVRALRIPLPEFPEQVEIATILSDMEAEIANLSGCLAKARQLKQGMMQELLTGRIRLI